jgi:uncharacterized membrane protein YkvA (DUF1232 family)
MNFFKKLLGFIRAVAEDERIPSRDKKVILALLAIMVSPLELVIPVIGAIDEIVITAIILDYLFNVLDDSVLLSHYPWGMKSFLNLRRTARAISFLTPSFIKGRIWKYEHSPYRG